MKRWICILLSVMLILALSVSVFGDAFAIDETAKLTGMDFTWYQGYEPVIQNNTMTIYLPLRSERCVGDISVSVTLDDPNVYLLASSPKEMKVSRKDGIYPVKLTLLLERNRRNGDYPVTITVTGSDEAGKELTEIIPYVLRIRDGKSSHERMEPIISNVLGNLGVGSDGSVCLRIINPTTTLSMMDCEIALSDSSGDVIMQDMNRVKITEILPGKSEDIIIPVSVRGNASVCLHTFEVVLRYHVMGQNEELVERFTLPVTQPIRLEHGGVQLPTAIAGEVSSMTLPLMNMGKGDLLNVLVKLEVDGALDAQSVLVGILYAGETKQAKLSFIPRSNSSGTYSGIVTITCEDAYGNIFSQTLDVMLTVDEPIPEADLIQEKENESVSAGTIILIILCIILITGIVIQGAVLTRKIHKLEEDRL